MDEQRNSVNTSPSVFLDRYAIRAEIERQGLSLTRIAVEAGLYKSACRQGLRGVTRVGAQAIADAVGIPFHILFANIPPYDAEIRRELRLNDKHNNRCAKGKSSKKTGQAVEGN